MAVGSKRPARPTGPATGPAARPGNDQPFRPGEAVLYLAGTDLWCQERSFEGRIVRVTTCGDYLVQCSNGHKPYLARARASQLRRAAP